MCACVCVCLNICRLATSVLVSLSILCSERFKNDELAAKKEEESKVAREKMREEQRRRREAVS